MNFKVSIIGRPNVGKSSLFNRILKKRLAIVHEKAGTTKDRIYAEAIWLNQSFFLIDTGGIPIENVPFKEKIKYQTEIAINDSDLILFVTDGQNKLVQEDLNIAKMIYPTKKKVLLTVNKIDNLNLLENIYDFYALGFPDIIGISAQHGIGIGELLDKIIYYHPKIKVIQKNNNDLKFCLVGKTNVGKSTLTNTILNTERMIVSDIPGTTIDSVDTIFQKNNQNYRIIDTAGLKKRSKNKNQEKYSYLRVLNTIEKSDIVCFLLDISQEITEQDGDIASIIFNYSKTCIIIANKWDLLTYEEKNIKKKEEQIKQKFKFFNHVPIIFLSAKEKKKIQTFFTILNQVFNNYKTNIPNHLLNDILYKAIQINPPSIYNKGKAKFYYIKQIATKPPEFLCLVNDPNLIHFSYERFLKNQLRLNLELNGVSLKIIFKKKESNFL